ncbi:hypothetical protein CDCA_CDCA11G3230 [Cyanidium caldarium]|uniref:Uncharacterized protein n=1 Tax=Cyanidium caldarium TaxID=2771 RepID=A0AAV9IYN1_CYACA|nr:hypothetical protein CDCA_CDCA11G3230 [Cyanidium caldarium]
MGFLSILRKARRKEQELRFLLIGLDNAGKTTVLRRLLGASEEEVRAAAPTLGLQVRTWVHPRGYRINLWDVGGQRSIRAYWKNYFEETDAVIWVVDAADEGRLGSEAGTELAAVLAEGRLRGVTLLVLANKGDVPGCMQLGEVAVALGMATRWRQVSEADGEALEAVHGPAGADRIETQRVAPSGHGNRHWRIYRCSAYTGQGVSEAFAWAVHDVATRLYSFDSQRWREGCTDTPREAVGAAALE